jgi:type IV pilus assembly protein PilX
MNSTPHTPARERGAVLIVALLFLVILTMLGVTAMSSTTMEERMAGNTRDSNLALEAAEAALRDAVRDIYGAAYVGVNSRAGGVKPSFFGDAVRTLGSCGSTGLCLPAYQSVGETDSKLPAAPAVDMTAAPSVEYGTYTNAPKLQGLAMQPRYIIENFCLVDQTGVGSIGGTFCNPNYYRITARGYGMNPNSQVTVQEVFLSALATP